MFMIVLLFKFTDLTHHSSLHILVFFLFKFMFSDLLSLHHSCVW